VPLSPQNPFLAANLLLARESERSTELAGFIRYRGAPPALELLQENFGNLTMQFYYPKKNESYALENVMGTWVIRGPLPIETEKLRDVMFATRDIEGEPLLLPPREPEPRSDGPTEAVAVASERLPSASELDPPRREITPGEQIPLGSQGFRSSTANPPRPRLSDNAREGDSNTSLPGRETSAEQERIIQTIIAATSRQLAEASPEGDIVHYVTFEGESLSLIARWYTYERTNVDRLARINNLTSPDRLQVGDTIIIPKYLAKNKVRLTEEGLKKLRAAFT
jgi:hypothetical protein